VENVERNLIIVAQSPNELILKELSENKSLTITKKSNNISLEGNLMDSIVGINEVYEIKKIQ